MQSMSKHIEMHFNRQGDLYVFQSDDGRISIAHSDRDQAGTAALLLVAELISGGATIRIEAHEPLGPLLRKFRDAGAICRPISETKKQFPTPPRPSRWQMPGSPVPAAGPPIYASWTDYLANTTYGQRMRRCYAAAKKANRKRLLSASPGFHLSGQDVWAVIENASGRCIHCGSLAVEGRPSHPTTGQPLPWAHVGRRIGSLEHLRWRLGGGDNDLSNLAWACLWCNTWEVARRWHATDHGGYFPTD